MRNWFRSLTHLRVAVLIVAFPLLAQVAQARALDNPPTLRPEEPLTLLARDVTLHDEPIANYMLGGPSISGDGSVAIYAIDRNDGPDGKRIAHVYRVVLPGSEPVEITTVGKDPQIDVSRDGNTVLLRTLPTSSSALHVADLSETRTIFEEDHGIELTDAVISSEGNAVYFTIRTRTRAIGIAEPIEPGLWAIDLTGSALRPVIMIDEIRDLIGAEADDTVYPGEMLTMDISAVADRLVFAVRNMSTSEHFVLAARGDGSETRLLHGPSASVARATISGSGSMVFVADVAVGDESHTARFHIMQFDGGSKHEIAPVLVGGAPVAEKGLMLSEDGSMLMAGNAGAIISTADGVARSLLTDCPDLHQIPGTLESATMSSTGHRVVYLSPIVDSNRLVVVDVQTDAAVLNQLSQHVAVNPPRIAAGEQDAATVTVAEDDKSAMVCVTQRRGFDLLADSIGLNDEGEEADVAAGDGVHTTGGLGVPELIDSGEVTLRIAIETVDLDGRRSTAVFEIFNALTIRSP